MWANQIELLTDAEIKQGLSTVLKSGAQHPPTLPEFLAQCRYHYVRHTDSGPEITDPSQTMAGRWFVRASLQFRFVGCDKMSLVWFGERCREICKMHIALIEDKDPEATEARIQGLLDAEAETFYPKAKAAAWLKAHPIVIDPKYRAA